MRRSPGTRLPTGAKEFKAGKSSTNLTFPSHTDRWNCEQKVCVLPDIFAVYTSNSKAADSCGLGELKFFPQKKLFLSFFFYFIF